MTNEYYRYLGYGVTDSNGVAHLEFDEDGEPLTHSYTGTGAGEIDVVASLDNPISQGSIVSETYSIIDGVFYDTGIDGTNYNHYYKSNITSYTPSTEYTTVLGGNTITFMLSNQALNTVWNQIKTFPVGTCMEFDIVDACNCMLLIYYDNNGTDLNTINETFCRLNNPTGHWKVEIKADGIYKNNEKIITSTITKSITVGFQTPNRSYEEGTSMVKFKNLVMYPI